MSKQFQKELSDLIEQGVIDKTTAARIEKYYDEKPTHGASRLLIVFGILGALLVGLGIILIVAHNWDSFSKTTRLVLAAMPLLIGQVVAFYLVLKKSQSIALREGTAAFIILSIGAVISLVSQIYNIQGDFGKFLFVWTLLAIPVVYVLESSVGSMLTWVGATSFVMASGFSHGSMISSYWYLFLIMLLTPHLVNLIRKAPNSNFLFFHYWIVPVSISMAFYAIDFNPDRLMLLSYVGLFGVFILISQLMFFEKLRLLINGWLVIGNLGTIYLLFFYSFEHWPRFYEGSIDVFLIVTAILYAIGLTYLIRTQGLRVLNPATWIFPLFAIIYFIGTSSPELSRVLINLMLLGLAIVIILEGAQKNHLGILNYGLLILSALVICRFFDTDISFVLRGLIFILVGAGFFGFNYWTIRKNKTN